MTSVWSPIILVGVVTFIIVGVFLGSFDDAVLATLMSLAVDIELNGKVTGGTPSFHEKLKKIEESLGESLTVVHVQEQQPLMGNNTQSYGVNTGGHQSNNMYEGGEDF
jgi:hypothetical protein